VSPRPYRPAAPVRARPLLAGLGWMLLTSVVVGGAAHALTRATFHVDLLIPAAIGLGAGASMAWIVTRASLARPALAAILAGAAATGALAVHLALDFRAARAARTAEIEELSRMRAGVGVSDEELAAVQDAMMSHWTLSRYARARIGLDDSGALTGTPPVLGRAGAVAVSLIEMCLALLIAGLWAAQAAADPACPRCGRWRVEHPIGAAAHGVAGEVVDRLLAGDAAGAAALLRPPDTREQVLLSALTCPDGHDGESGVVRVSEVSWTRRRRLAMRRVADLETGAEELGVLRAAFGQESVG
jgi:hypothetical protein